MFGQEDPKEGCSTDPEETDEGSMCSAIVETCQQAESCDSENEALLPGKKYLLLLHALLYHH